MMGQILEWFSDHNKVIRLFCNCLRFFLIVLKDRLLDNVYDGQKTAAYNKLINIVVNDCVWQVSKILPMVD